VAEESANPVARHAVPQHGVAIFARRYDVVLPLVVQGREVDVRDGARVAVAGERHHLCRVRHSVFAVAKVDIGSSPKGASVGKLTKDYIAATKCDSNSEREW
jgi:hypothetical protein